MPISEILRWLVVVVVVVLLVIAFFVVAFWPGLNHLARLIGMAGCVCGVLMMTLLSQPLLWVFSACVVAAALVGQVEKNREHRREAADMRRREFAP